MGRNTDKLYITHREWSGVEGGKHGASGGISKSASLDHRPQTQQLPFDTCALSLQPWTHPVAAPGELQPDGTRKGDIFDLLAIVPWLKSKGTHPLTCEPLQLDNLITLHFHKSDSAQSSEYADPITAKPFNTNTRIVAIATSGNVFARDTIDRLNLQSNHMRDLLTDEPFTKADILTLQDHTLASVSSGTKRKRDEQSVPEIEPSASRPCAEIAQEPRKLSAYSTGRTAASLTSTGAGVSTGIDRAVMTEEEYLLSDSPRYTRVKTVGLATIETSIGTLDIELFPEHAPRAVWNFITLANANYFDGLRIGPMKTGYAARFGDPGGSRSGGRSCWSTEFLSRTPDIVPLRRLWVTDAETGAFTDEISVKSTSIFTLDTPGFLVMAPAKANANLSVFSVTLGPTPALSGRRTCFGKCVGPLSDATLRSLNNLEIDPQSNRPTQDITITEIVILRDPFKHHLRHENQLHIKQGKIKQSPTQDDLHTWSNARATAGPIASAHSLDSSCYTYKPAAEQRIQQREIKADAPVTSETGKLKQQQKSKFGKFAGW
ncbi:cyclophilin peptidyl-prolyl cis-trans isomerase Cyp8 [Savitreella phatthalungensis]